MSTNEDMADEVRTRIINLMRVAASLRVPVQRELTKLQDRLAQEITRTEFGIRPGTRFKRMQELFETVQGTIKAAYRGISTAHARELKDLVQVEAQWAADALQASLPPRVALITTVPSAAQIAAVASDTLIVGAPTAEWWSRYAGDNLERFKDTIRQGMLAGETRGQMVDRVEPLMDKYKKHSDTLVRSSVMAVANNARQETYRQNDDLIKSWAWVSTLDSRTTVQCAARDGKEWDARTFAPIGHSIPWGGGPPIHHNCRSTVTPVVKSWEELGIDAEEADPSTRASLDGQVPENQTFEQFLSKKPAAFQDAVLGKYKADLWRQGTIKSLGDLLDQTGRPLTVAELKKKYSKR